MSHNSLLSDRIGYRMARQAPAVKPEEETSPRAEAGTMIDSRGGVMAADRLGELRAQRIGEVVDYAERLLERRFNGGHAQRWQELWSKSLAAVPLSDEERAEMDTLNVEQQWSARVALEQKARVAALRAMGDSAAVAAFNVRGGWPE